MAPGMMLTTTTTLLLSMQLVTGTPRGGRQLVTCPGFPGYCSESYVGDTCTVVCARGRNNVPQCQEDGTWTDVPRCIEHEPGIEEQVTGVCPGIPGYCSLDLPGAVCEFACPVGAPIRSECTEDGTWEPYPTCEGDPRETQDGCNPCPGPNGEPRNRTLGGGGQRNSGGNRGGQRPQNIGGQRPSNNRNNGNAGGQRPGNNRSNGNAGGQRRPQANNKRPSNGGQRSNGGGQRSQGGGQRPKAGGQGQRSKNNRGQQQSNNNRPRPAPAVKEFQEPRALDNNSNSNSRPSSSNSNRVDSSGQCPGSELAACIDVCPGFSARVFGACVAGCAKRCPGKK